MNKNYNSTEEKEKEDPVEELEKIDEKYSKLDYVNAPESLGLEKKEYISLTDDEIESLVKEKVGSKESGVEKIQNDYLKKLNALEGNKQTIEKNSDKAKAEINEVYDNQNKIVSDDVLKRGLARSSIAISKIAGVERARADELTKEMEEVNSKLSAVQNEIISLEGQKEEALDSFDLSYAKKIEEEINNKKAELEKQKNEVIEFNNKVTELEAEYKLSLDKQKQDAEKHNIEMKEKYGYTQNELDAEDAKYEYMMSYLEKLSKAEALDLLLNNEKIQSLLGENFMAIYAYTRNRKE